MFVWPCSGYQLCMEIALNQTPTQKKILKQASRRQINFVLDLQKRRFIFFMKSYQFTRFQFKEELQFQKLSFDTNLNKDEEQKYYLFTFLLFLSSQLLSFPFPFTKLTHFKKLNFIMNSSKRSKIIIVYAQMQHSTIGWLTTQIQPIFQSIRLSNYFPFFNFVVPILLTVKFVFKLQIQTTPISTIVTMIYLIFVFGILSSRAFIISQTFTFQRSIGQWSETIIGEQGQPNVLNAPSRYFVCGVSIKSLKWQKVLQNCKCSNRWYRWRRQIKCDKCVNYFETKTSGIKAIFCDYDDWDNQITKIIEKDSPNDGPWRNMDMCPQSMYVNGIAGFLTTQHQTDIGLAGIRVQCSTLSLRNNTILNNPQFSVPLNFAKNGRFFSSFSIKYNGDEVVGLKANFEQPVVISQIKIKYQPVKESIPFKMNVWQSSFVNERTELQTRSIQIKKPVTNLISWSVGKNYILDYQFSNSAVLNLPNNLLNDMKLERSSINKPRFNTKIELRLTYQNQMTVLIAKCSKLTTKYELMYSKETIPFEAQLTLSGIYSQQMVRKQKVVGVWEGNIYKEIGVDISQVTINSQKCSKKNIRL